VKKLLIISVLTTGISLSAAAQIEFSLQGSVELPVDELRWVFKPGTGVIATLSKIKKYKKKGSAFGVSFGYSKYVPKQDLFYYLVNTSEVGTIKYDQMKAYQLSAQFRKEYIIRKQIELFYGLEIGIYYIKYGFESQDAYQHINSSNFIGRYVLAPKAGINYQVNKQVGVFFQTRYMLNIAKTDDADDNINLYWANSLGVNYRF
jgi:hypothetical protein